MEKRIAAYAFIFIAGLSTEFLAFFLLGGANGLAFHFSFTNWDNLLIDIMPGMAAVIAAAALHIPFMRAVRTGRRLPLYGWTLLGVVCAHAAYALLMLFYAYFFPRFPTHQSPELFALQAAYIYGLFSLALGFIPNLLYCIGKTEALLWLEKKLPAPAPAS